MILPIYAYGHPVLRQKTKEIPTDYPDFAGLLNSMWETMYFSRGMGLAAPQVGLALRLFLVDSLQLEQDEHKGEELIKQAFINPVIVAEGGKPYNYEEGCLSIPDIRGKVERPAQVKLRYQDEQFKSHERVFTGITARIIQHEYDHIEGVLFTDHLNALKRRLIKKKLDKISRGQISPSYRMVFPGS